MWTIIWFNPCVRVEHRCSYLCCRLLNDTMDREGDALPTLHVLKVAFFLSFFYKCTLILQDRDIFV